VFYEAPQRITESLADMAAVLGSGRKAVIAREITKAFETIRRGRLEDLAAAVADEPQPKGELTILIGPPTERVLDADAIDEALREALRNSGVGEAAAAVAAATGLSKRSLYARALELKTGRS
jgi:16S rRNA (cytidine1402-2'-O)-methyltransferase